MKDDVTLRVRNWTRFEHYRTRRLRNLRRIRVPIVLESEGYRTLLSHGNGAAHYGAWVSILMVAAKCNPRGTLLRDNSKPHTTASLAAMTAFPEEIFAQAIPRLLEIGWLELVGSGHEAKRAPTGTGISGEDAPPPNGTIAESDCTVLEHDRGEAPSQKKQGVGTNDDAAF